MREYAAGASSSLNKTITEIVDFLDIERPMTEGQLRDALHEALADLAESWYRRGFVRGHRVCHEYYTDRGKFPRVARYEGERLLFIDNQRTIKLKSRLRSASSS